MVNLNQVVTDAEIKAVAALSETDRADLIARINATNPFTIFDLVEGKDDEIICPICYSGSGKNGKNTGIKPSLVNGVWLYNCFSGNDCNGDLIKVIADANNLPTKGKEFFEVLAIAANVANISVLASADETPKPKKISAPITKTVEKLPAAEYSRLTESRKNISSFVESQGGKWRGLTLETLQRLKWGFLQNYKHPDNNFVFPAVIIPNDLNGILARRVDGDNKSNISPTATTTIFLPDSEEFDLIITEGAINGASILQAVPAPTFGIMASGGTSGNKNVLARLQQLKSSGKKIRVIIAYDGDKAGQKAAYKLYTMLQNAGYYVFIHTIILNSKIDLNDFLRNQGAEQLKEFVESALVDARKTFDEEKANIFKASDKKQVPADVENFADNSKFDFDSEIDSLKIELQEVEKQIADFNTEKENAIEDLKNIETFDTETIFADNVLTAAAFAKLYNRQVYSETKTAIQKYKKLHPEKGVGLPDFGAAVNEKVKSIKTRIGDLEDQRIKFKMKIESLKFIKGNDFLQQYTFPDEFTISDKYGVEKITKGTPINVCRLPLLIKEKFQSVEDSTYKYILTYKENGKWKISPPTPASVIFNQRKIADLADYNLPITSVNSFNIVDWLDAFKKENSSKFPLTKTVRRGGWYNFNGKDYFLDPRKNCEYTAENGENCRVIVEDNYFTKGLKTSGIFDKWKKAYQSIIPYPVARAIVDATICAPLLYLLGERTFIFYVYGKTTSGKSTALKLGASLFGDTDKVVRNFNGTTKGLAELAAVVNDYSLLIDEKQGADEKLRDNLIQLIYNYAEGQGRTRLDSKANLKDIENWRTVVVMNGETPLHDDNATAGSFTRTLSIALKDTILPPDICAEIWDIIKENYGFAFAPYIDAILNYGIENLREKYKEIVAGYKKMYPEILPEYCRYLAVLTLADAFLNISLGVEKMAAIENAVKTIKEIFPLIPTTSEIDDATREIDFVLDYIARNQRYFLGATDALIKDLPRIDGRFKKEDSFCYITKTALKKACKEEKYNYENVVIHLITNKTFIPADTIEKDRKKPRPTVKITIGEVKRDCFRIPRAIIEGEEN